ncbi:hypothetical protein BS78_09G058300 [Paspalum vaginatum]|nr:hypothetical protein BS78_09G058300 [Paspalum vaginatum]
MRVVACIVMLDRRQDHGCRRRGALRVLFVLITTLLLTIDVKRYKYELEMERTVLHDAVLEVLARRARAYGMWLFYTSTWRWYNAIGHPAGDGVPAGGQGRQPLLRGQDHQEAGAKVKVDRTIRHPSSLRAAVVA